jgi:hypothetical protein
VLSNHTISQLNPKSPAIKSKQCPNHHSFYKECNNMNQHIKIKHLATQDQNTRQIHNIKVGNKSFETVEQFKYLGTILTYQNSIHEEIRSRLKSGNACYPSGQNLLSSSLLSKNIKINIRRTIILPVVLYGRKTWSLTLREEHRLRVFENRVLRKCSGLRGANLMLFLTVHHNINFF